MENKNKIEIEGTVSNKSRLIHNEVCGDVFEFTLVERQDSFPVRVFDRLAKKCAEKLKDGQYIRILGSLGQDFSKEIFINADEIYTPVVDILSQNKN